MNRPLKPLEPALAALRAQALYRTRRLFDGPQQVRQTVAGHEVLSFCSNDYLGLAADPRLSAALQEGARRYGVGSGAAHLIVGHRRAHQELEDALAAFVGRPRALLFATGYLANLSTIAALAERGEWIFADRLVHASLIDGVRLSGAQWRRYPHCDAQALTRLLAERDAVPLIVTDGVFSMDGDLAPLPELVPVARAAGARLLVDDAHGLGTIGPEGRGTLAHFGLGLAEVPILIGTLGKAFGTFGAFVAGEEALIETLIQGARGYIYTTAPPPALAHATLTALKLAQDEPWRRAQLAARVAEFRAGAAQLGLPISEEASTPIQPLSIGSAAHALDWSRRLEARGLLVAAIRPPTVPRGTARLRIAFSAAHTAADVARLLDGLAAVARETART